MLMTLLLCSSTLRGADLYSLYPVAARGVDVVNFNTGSFILAGLTGRNGGVALFKLDDGFAGKPCGTWDYGRRNERAVLPGDEPVKMIAASGGGYIILAELKPYSAAREGISRQAAIWVIKISDNGTEEWTRVYDGGAVGYKPFDIIGTPDSGYLITGVAVEQTVKWKGLLIKINSRGDLQWKKVMQATSYCSLNRAVCLSNGGYFLYGYDRVQDRVNYWLQGTDPLGNRLWQKLYPGMGDMLRIPVMPGEGGSVFAHIKTENRTPRMAGISDAGKLLFDGPVTGLYPADNLSGYVNLKDGASVFCGHTKNADSDILLCKIGSGNRTLWRKSLNIDGDDMGVALVKMDDGFLVAAVTSYSYDYSIQAYSYKHALIKTDFEGNRKWIETFTLGRADSVAGAVLLPGNRCALLVSTIRNSRSEALLLLTEPGGNIGTIREH